MIRVVTVEQMQRMDRTEIENRTPGTILMDRAGKAVALRTIKMMESDRFSALILAGGGNNGGDGWVCARYLKENGERVLVLSLTPPEKLTGDAKEHCEKAIAAKVEHIMWDGVAQYFEEADIIVDALLGTGSRGTPRGKYRDAIEMANRSGKKIIAVDIPSGVDGNSGMTPGIAIAADTTVSMACPKLGHLIYPGRQHTGELFIADIGIDTENDKAPDIRLLQREDAQALLPARKPDGHKGSFGKGYILAGSAGMSGAAALSSLAFLRAGAGLAYLGTAGETAAAIASATLEIVKHPLPTVGKFGALSLRALGEIHKRLEGIDCLAIGPGLGSNHETAEMVRRLIAKVGMPIVVDADGINALEQNTRLNGNIVLTPHPGELSRLLGLPLSDVLEQRFSEATIWAERLNATLLIKGSPTIIAHFDGRLRISATGNDGMGTAGSGDVLTGTIASFIAQGLDPFDAACLGAFVHGVAGDIAAIERGRRGMTSRDILDFLPDALQIIEDSQASK